MKLQHVVISVLIISMVILGSVTFINELRNNYGTTADLSSLNKTQERLNDMQENTEQLKNDITDFELETIGDFFDIPYKLIKVGWGVAKTIFNSFTVIKDIGSDTVTGLSDAGLILPSWFLPTIISILLISLVSILIYAFFKWKFED